MTSKAVKQQSWRKINNFPCSVIVDFSSVAKHERSLLRFPSTVALPYMHVHEIILMLFHLCSIQLRSSTIRTCVDVFGPAIINRQRESSLHLHNADALRRVRFWEGRVVNDIIDHQFYLFISFMNILGGMESDSIQPLRLHTPCLWNQLRRNVESSNSRKL